MFDRQTGAFSGAVPLPAGLRVAGDDVAFVLDVAGTTYGVARDGRRHGRVWTAT